MMPGAPLKLPRSQSGAVSGMLSGNTLQISDQPRGDAPMYRLQDDQTYARCLDSAMLDTAERRSTHTGRLVLTPQNPHLTFAPDQLIEPLLAEGFIGTPLGVCHPHAFAVGAQFLSLVSFNGCAVSLKEATDAGNGFCHVVIEPPSAQIRAWLGRNTRAPRCESCRTRLSEWSERMEQWCRAPRAGLECPHCGEIRPPWLWDWKQRAGFGRTRVWIEEVFPGEALPGHALIERLTLATGTGWRYFYMQD